MNQNVLDAEETRQIETLFRKYQEDPSSVDDSWRLFFEGYEFAQLNRPASGPVLTSEFRVINLINGYRTRGHLFTLTNPVRERRKYLPTLDLENFGLSESDLDTVFQAGTLVGLPPSTLKEIIAHLEATYCRSIGAEYKYIRTPEVLDWLERRMEGCRNSREFSLEERKQILKKVGEAVFFENFIHTKYVGQKSFSLEGCEALIPALDAIIASGAETGIKEFTIGMAHRGRLNVLANIMEKSYHEIFAEFEDHVTDRTSFSGDVKYHLGYSSDVLTASGKKIHLSLAPNPSHLETVDPVVQGIVRSKIDQTEGGNENMIAPVLIHGDAAIAGQGVVYEVVQMSQLKGYRTGGTIHIVINNQIGFTTNYQDARSSTYCTDVAKVTLSPVFHVNGDDVEALVYTVQLALEFRQKFHRDVFIDILGFRKYGHNETDEPRFTQPLLYKAIAVHPNLLQVYSRKLEGMGLIEAGYIKVMESEFRSLLQANLEQARKPDEPVEQVSNRQLRGKWKGLRKARPDDFLTSPPTGVNQRILSELADKLTTLPPGKKFFDKTVRLFAERKNMVEKGRTVNWAMAELLAYASLLAEGIPVRMSGQDVERGTFSHRHAVIPVEDSEEQFIPLNHLGSGQAPFYIYNSLLSEYAVVGFDYGYALSSPYSLVIWEAQFGDFSNGAQIIIDQYLSSGEDKWNMMNGLVLLLPHGFEGQGAEHSSARLERFLQLCAEENIQVVNTTTPSNFFHVIRRQMKREFRKPLVVFTPKSLLRHPRCVSSMTELSLESFKEVLDDSSAVPERVTKLVMCSGKIYYELLERKLNDNASDVALVRIEQLYPFPKKQVEDLIAKYSNAFHRIWVQEEPENMGAYNYLRYIWPDLPLIRIAREASASPATGSHKAHSSEQTTLLDRVFAGR